MKTKKTIATILVLLIAAIFLVRTLLNYYGQAQHIVLSISPIKVFVSFCLFLGYLYLRALSWKSLVQFLGASINKTNSLSIWFFSEATRYIPGSVWSFASRAYLAQQKKISRNISILISPVEAIVVITATTSLSLFAIIKNLEKFQTNLAFFILAVTSLLITLILLLFHKTVAKLFKKLLAEDLIPKAMVTALILQFLGWSLYSIGYIILIPDLAKIPNPLLLFSSTLLAWLIGYLSIITPMGLGIRESAFILLTGTQIGIPEAVLIAVLSRIILIVAELTNLIFWACFKRKISLFN